MNLIEKIYSHVKNGTLYDRVKQERSLRKWQEFLNSDNDYIYKKLKNKLKLKLYKNSILSEIIYLNKFEKSELVFIEKVLKKGDVFFDIGANIGLFSLVVSKKIGKKGKIYSFEPSSNIFERLCENININYIKNINPQKLALSNEKGKAKFTVSLDGYDAWNSLSKPSAGKRFDYEIVETETLDGFIKKHNLKGKIFLIKLDVEGWEIPVIKGGLEALSDKDAPIMMVEFTEQNAINSGFSCKELYQLITDLGYKLYSYNSKKNHLSLEKLRGTYPYINLFAIKNINEVKKRMKSVLAA